MASIDADGRSLGHVAPKYPARLDTETIRRELLRTGTCPATRGAAMPTRRAAERLSPIAPTGGMIWLDPVLEVNAPFHGEVLTLKEPLARYRIHSSNSIKVNELSPAQFARYLSTAELKMAYIQERCAPGDRTRPRGGEGRSIWDRNARWQRPNCRRPAASPLRGPRTGYAAVRCPPYGAKQRAILLAWFTAVAISPRGVAKDLDRYRFVVGRRPRWLERIVRLMTL